jgi:uncharacterized membrane protein YkoI
MKKSLFTGRRRWIIAGTAGVLLVGGATAATAAVVTEDDSDDQTSQSQVDDSTDAGDDTDDGKTDGDDAAAQSAPEVSPAEAAETALSEVSKGVLVSVELEGTKDTPVWSVDLVTSDYTEHDVRIDATDGSVADKKSEKDNDADDWDDDSAIAKAASVDIDEAVKAAQDEVAGTVTSIEREGSEKSPLWSVDIVADDGSEHEVSVNATDGSIADSVTDDDSNDDADDDKDDKDDD